MSAGLRHANTEPDHLDAKRERVGRVVPSLRRAPSDSDCSGETASLSADSADRVRGSHPPPRLAARAGANSRSRRRGSEWEVLEGLKDGQRFERRPDVFNGYLHKKRKWPLKGWHKRFFVVDGGILVYARSAADVARGRLHGSVDVGLSVISAKARRRRIDIDADEFIYHLRAKTHDLYRTWLNVLKAHRLYRQHLLTFGARDPTGDAPAALARAGAATAPTDNPLLGPTATSSPAPHLRAHAGFVAGTPGGRFSHWMLVSGAEAVDGGAGGEGGAAGAGGGVEAVSRALTQAQVSVHQLQRLLDAIDRDRDRLHHLQHDHDMGAEGASPVVKKDRRKFGLRKKKSNSKCASVDASASAAAGALSAEASHGVGVSAPALSVTGLAAPSSPGALSVSAHASHTSLPIACAAARPQSLPGAEALSAAGVGGSSAAAAGGGGESVTPDLQLREDFTVLAKDLVSTLRTALNALVCERNRVRAAVEAAEAGGERGAGAGPPALLAALRTNLNSALHQNSARRDMACRRRSFTLPLTGSHCDDQLRARLLRIHDASDLGDLSSPNNDPSRAQFQPSLSYSSSCVSASEFFDAEELEPAPAAHAAPTAPLSPLSPVTAAGAGAADILPGAQAVVGVGVGVIELDGDSSSEAGSLSSEEGTNASSDNSDGAPDMVSAEAMPAPELPPPSSDGSGGAGAEAWRRRSQLPAPRPTPGGPSLWNLLYKNIGKDLSQVSMPVTINEPLNMLQRLCEELEYSRLVELACACACPVERAALVCAFAVSAYAATAHRAASKPFNPLLAETYECHRPDKGFHFLAEQVSHHPPVSACWARALDGSWEWWQEARIKTKFWGKSMEFQPAGLVHLRLNNTGDHYSWNKVTTCVHNLFGGQRWVDQYGDMVLVCHGSPVRAKLQFIKASSWSSSRHEVRGLVTDERSGARLRLAGRWSEGLYAGESPNARCLWRPGAMPAMHEQYYGFTRFAMQLNEIEPGHADTLPRTDTRFRPDQRALEQGDVEAAERHKLALEQAQRDRRRNNDHQPLWFRKEIVEEDGSESWVFTGEYWVARERGFADCALPQLW